MLLTAGDGGEWWTLAFLILVVCCDTGAYVAGLNFGKHPMAPTISPKKTWEGFAGAVVAAVLAGILLSLFMIQQEWWFGVVLGLVIVVTATLGDWPSRSSSATSASRTSAPGCRATAGSSTASTPCCRPRRWPMRCSSSSRELPRRMSRMTTTFPSAGRRERGYDPDQVDAFLRDARRCYDDEADRSLTSETIRRVSFDMRRGGYSAAAVDRVLERLEDAFAVRERDRTVARVGADAWNAEARRAAQEILDRVSRPTGERFDRAGFLTTGYDRREVDRFADRVAKYFRGTKPMSVDDVRTVAFHPRRGGYREAQVDLLLDAVIDVMNAVR